MKTLLMLIMIPILLFGQESKTDVADDYVKYTFIQNQNFPDFGPNKFNVGIKYLHVDGHDLFTTFTGLYDLTLSYKLNPGTSLIFSLPYYNMTFSDENFSSISDNGIGNIYIGGLQRFRDGHSTFEFGVYLPTLNTDDGSFLFIPFADPTKMYRFMEDYLTLLVDYKYQYNKENFYASLGGGMNFWLPTKNEEGYENELFLHYSLIFGAQFPFVNVQFEYEGQYILTEDQLFGDDKTVSVLKFGAMYPGEQFRPGIYYQVLLNSDISDIFDDPFGFQLDFVF